jgi:hypothetical protein
MKFGSDQGTGPNRRLIISHTIDLDIDGNSEGRFETCSGQRSTKRSDT